MLSFQSVTFKEHILPILNYSFLHRYVKFKFLCITSIKRNVKCLIKSLPKGATVNEIDGLKLRFHQLDGAKMCFFIFKNVENECLA